MAQSVFETTATALVIVGVGVVFYLLGGKTRRETAPEPVAPAYVPADDHEPAP